MAKAIDTTVSDETLWCQKVALEYGSVENYEAKQELVRAYAGATNSYERLVNERKSKRLNEHVSNTIDAIRKKLGGRVPYWMDLFALREIPLALIGSPEGSREWNREYDKIEDSEGWAWDKPGPRAMEPVGVLYRDYSELGWPASAGNPVRRVTPHEGWEISRRLSSAGLTKPGAEVATVGKTLAQMIEEDEPVPGWIIEGILREGGAAMVYGPSGVGKTWFTHTLMLMAAAGHGAGVHNPQTDRWMLKAGEHEGVKVCLLDGEMIPADITSRAKVLCDALGLRMAGSMQGVKPVDLSQLRLVMLASGDDTDEVEVTIKGLRGREEPLPQGLSAVPEADGPCVDLSKIIVYPKADQDHRAEFVDLADAAWKHKIVKFCRDQGIKVLILDNLATLSESLKDENDATAINPLNSLIVALKKEGVATILVHHTNKGGSGYRGSTNLATTLEAIVGLHKVEGAKAAEGATFRVQFDKSRAFGQPEADGKTLKLREGRWVCEVDVIDQAARVVEMVRSLRFKTQAEVGVELGVDQATVSRIFMSAVKLGLVIDGELPKKLREARELAKQLSEPVGPECEDEENSGIPF